MHVLCKRHMYVRWRISADVVAITSERFLGDPEYMRLSASERIEGPCQFLPPRKQTCRQRAPTPERHCVGALGSVLQSTHADTSAHECSAPEHSPVALLTHRSVIKYLSVIITAIIITIIIIITIHRLSIDKLDLYVSLFKIHITIESYM